MRKALSVLLLVAGYCGVAMAGRPPSVPEIDPSTGAAALALLSGAVLVLRGRRSNR